MPEPSLACGQSICNMLRNLSRRVAVGEHCRYVAGLWVDRQFARHFIERSAVTDFFISPVFESRVTSKPRSSFSFKESSFVRHLPSGQEAEKEKTSAPGVLKILRR